MILEKYEKWKEIIRKELLEELDVTRELSDEEICKKIDEYLTLGKYANKFTIKEKVKLQRELFNSLRRLDILQPLIEDESITEIMVNGADKIFIERNGKLQEWDQTFSSKEKLEDLVHQIAGFSNRTVSKANPIVDARLLDGSRVNVVLDPVAIQGPVLTIRKFPKEPVTMEELLTWQSISTEVSNFLKQAVVAGYNIFISGGTGAGKTTFLNALSTYIPKTERIITIEDNAELQIQGIENLVQLEAKQANLEGKNEITIRDLIRTALRMRPSRIIVGEVRGAEALDMLQAMNTGHSGSLSTGHANSAQDMLSRLETMVLMGAEIPISAIRRQIVSGVDLVVHLGRLRDKTRRVLAVSEVIGLLDGEFVLQTLYEFQEKAVLDTGKIQGEWTKVNELQNREKLKLAGLEEIDGL